MSDSKWPELPICPDGKKYNEKSFLYRAFNFINSIGTETESCKKQNIYSLVSLCITIGFRIVSLGFACCYIVMIIRDKSDFFKTPTLTTAQILFCISIIISGLPYLFYYLPCTTIKDFYSLNYVSVINDRFTSDTFYLIPAVISTFGDLMFYFFYIINTITTFRHINCCYDSNGKSKVAECFESIEDKKCKCCKKKISKKYTRCEMSKIIVVTLVSVVFPLLLSSLPFINNHLTIKSTEKLIFKNEEGITNSENVEPMKIPIWDKTSLAYRYNNKIFNEETRNCMRDGAKDSGKKYKKLMSNENLEKIVKCKVCSDKNKQDECNTCYKSLCVFLFENNYSEFGSGNKEEISDAKFESKDKEKIADAKGYEFSTLYPVPLPVDDFLIRSVTYDLWFVLSGIGALIIFIASLYSCRKTDRDGESYPLYRYMAISNGIYFLVTMINITIRAIVFSRNSSSRKSFYSFLTNISEINDEKNYF